MSEWAENVLSAIAAIIAGSAFMTVIVLVSRCESENVKARENKMMECVRQRCNWIDENCLCTLSGAEAMNE